MNPFCNRQIEEKRIAIRAVPYERCCAKSGADGEPGISVYDHGRYAGVVANFLLKMLPDNLKTLLSDDTGFLVSLHDIGKVSLGFQGKYFSATVKDYSPESIRLIGISETNHASIGAYAYMRLAGVEQTDAVVMAIAGHHGSFPQNISPNTDGPCWQNERAKLVSALAMAFGTDPRSVKTNDTDARLLTGLTCVADWIASNEDFFPQKGETVPEDRLSRYVESTLSKIGFASTKFVNGLTFGELFQDEKGNRFDPRSEQRALMDVVRKPGVYVMEATMGAGKTEAALSVAYDLISKGCNTGIYFALPTRLTSDRIYLRMQRFLDRANADKTPVRLSHGRAWLSDYQVGGVGNEGRELPSWFAPSKRGLLYPFAVGTIDQALLAAMNVRHSCVRLFGLAGKVIILDEIHSYDMYTGSLVEVLVRDLRRVGCTVVILSATLTRAKRDALLGCTTREDAAYPLISGNACGELLVKTPRVDMVGKRIVLHRIEGAERVVDEALIKARVGCNVLCVANTVRQAQRWYRLLKTTMREDDIRIHVELLHSRFPDFRRGEIEEKWMGLLGKGDNQRPKGSILISTQIVEQSVDIDADYLITELAPIDMLFQRMGRLWRHDRGMRPVAGPECVIAFDGVRSAAWDETEETFRSTIGAGTCCVYAPYVLLRTLRVLEGREELSIPNDMRMLLETVYAELDEPSDSTAARFKNELDEKKREMQGAAIAAGASVVSMPVRDDSEDAPPTRYGTRRTVSLLLVRSCDDGAGHGKARIELLDGKSVSVDTLKRDFSVTKALYENTVLVPVGKLLGEQSREYERKLLCCHFHAGETPLLCRVEADGRLTAVGTGDDLGLSYRDDMGVHENPQTGDHTAGGGIFPDEQSSFDLGGSDW